MPVRTTDAKSHLAEVALLGVLGALWGVPYALTKLSLATIPPITLTAARVTIAAATLWLIAFALRRTISWRWDLVARVTLQGCLVCVVPYTLIAFGQQSVDSALAVILNSATPVFVCLLTIVWTRHEVITYRRLLGVLIGLGGVVGIAGANALSGFGRETLGEIAILLATLSSAAGVIHGRRFIDAPPDVVAAGTLTAAAIILIPACLAIEAPWQITPSAASVTALVANAIVATALGFTIYFRLLRTIGSTSTASASYLKPAVGVTIGCVLLNEPLTWTVLGGLAAVLVGVAATTSRLPDQISKRSRCGLFDQRVCAHQ
jgi:drug/metabolite transporter (DMT)-like permease